MAVKVLTKSKGKGTTEIVPSNAPAKKTEEPVGPEVVSDHPLANVGIRLGITIPTGDYANIRAEVSCHLPCEVADIDATFEKAQQWADARLDAIAEAVKSA